MVIKIRVAKISDVPRLIRLWKGLMEFHKDLYKNDKREIYVKMNNKAEEKLKKWIIKNIKSKNSLVLIAKDKKQLVGYSLNFIKKNIPIFEVRRLGNLGDLYIEKRYRSKGIASRFRKMAIAWFKNKKIFHYSIHVHAKNSRAHSIYRKWGFKDFHVEMRT